jgi:hypothetical protein
LELHYCLSISGFIAIQGTNGTINSEIFDDFIQQMVSNANFKEEIKGDVIIVADNASIHTSNHAKNIYEK